MEEILYQRKVEADDSLGILEKLGYSKELAKKRVQIYENAGKGIGLYETVKFQVDYNVVIAGSRGDGTGVYVDCDVDKLLVQNNLKCIEKGFDAKISNNDSTVLELDTEDVPNGYTKLKFISKADDQRDKIHTNILEALDLKNENGQLYLRNDCILSPGIGRVYTEKDCGWIEKNLVHADTKTGPSKPYRIRTPFLPNYILLDDVLAFRCFFPTIIDTWCSRERSKDWPSKELVEKVKEMEVYVVPVGVKGSKDEHLQWRICLTQAELALVQSFNDTQIKVYGALKMITKHHLTPICENITSYIIKIVLFWQMEQTYCSEWNAEHFKERFVNSLVYLKTCVETEQLPNYMIPARNMLHDKITALNKQSLMEKINLLINSCPYTYIKSIVIKEVFNAEPEDFAYGIQEKMLTSMSIDEKESDQLTKSLHQRVVREQFVLAIFALPPEDIAAVLKQVFEVREQSTIVEIIAKKVLPYIRQHNPYGFFNEIKSMDVAHIYSVCGGTNVSVEKSCILL